MRNDTAGVGVGLAFRHRALIRLEIRIVEQGWFWLRHRLNLPQETLART